MPAHHRAVEVCGVHLRARTDRGAPQCYPRDNLKWDLPSAAATGPLIASGDHHTNNHSQSPSFVRAATQVSHVGLGIELGTSGRLYSWAA